MSKRSIAKLLTSPSKVANALDWKKSSGSLLSLTISKEKIDLAVSSHPSFEEPPTQLPSIHLKTKTADNVKVLDPSVARELEDIVKRNSVCSMVVSWPVQERGWCGAPCGRVLHTLDQLISQSKSLLGKSRPICLWDEEHHLPPVEDEWGRASIYSHTPREKSEHRASTEQYADNDTAATDVWNDFFRSHWPELYYQRSQGEFSLAAGTEHASHASSAGFPLPQAADETAGAGQSLRLALL